MKKYICTALALLMAASLFVGCGCTNRNVSDNPNGKITAPTVAPTTNPMPTMTTPPEETTRATTAPTQEATMPTTGMTDSTDTTGDTSTNETTDHTGSPDETGTARSGRRWADRHS